MRFRLAAKKPLLYQAPLQSCLLVMAMALALASQPAMAQTATDKAKPAAPIVNSPMSAELFYQVLLSEVRLRQNDPGYAYQVYLEIAKQHRDSQLFQRSVEVALGARAGEQALAAAKAWRQAQPQDRAATEYTAHILMALGRTSELPEVIRALVLHSPKEQVPQVISTLPRSMMRMNDRKAAAQVIDEATAIWREPAPGMAEAWVASSEAWLNAGDLALAKARLEGAQAANAQSIGVGLLAAELMSTYPELEALVTQQLAKAPTPVLRLAYARKLLAGQRMNEAAQQLEGILAQQPDNALALLTLGAVRIELKQLDAAELSITRYLANAAAPAQSKESKEPSAQTPPAPEADIGYVRMAQISELRGQLAQADTWLQKADPRGEKISIQVARAKLLAAQGQLAQARAMLKSIPESEPRDAVVKINAEAQLLRDAKQFQDAYQVLQQATQLFPQDADLAYDQAMMAEALKLYDEAENLLRKVLQLQPEHPYAHNALGYSLADRGVRLDEARTLILKALEAKPGDPFIVDSLGWLEFRSGNSQDALKWLRQAYVSRPDAEIAAHLGEVLWTLDQRDEALRIWREGLGRDKDNETLQKTIQRLKAPL